MNKTLIAIAIASLSSAALATGPSISTATGSSVTGSVGSASQAAVGSLSTVTLTGPGSVYSAHTASAMAENQVCIDGGAIAGPTSGAAFSTAVSHGTTLTTSSGVGSGFAGALAAQSGAGNVTAEAFYRQTQGSRTLIDNSVTASSGVAETSGSGAFVTDTGLARSSSYGFATNTSAAEYRTAAQKLLVTV
jgi:hypothetical protein